MTTSWFATVFQAFSKPLKWWVVVAPWESGVRVRLGKTAKELVPGIHFRIPFLDRVYIQPCRLRYIASSGHSLSSKDGAVFTISLGVGYKISSVKELFMEMSNPEIVLMTMALANVAEYISNACSNAVTPKVISSVAAKGISYKGLEDIHVTVVSFAKVKCYRFITGDGYLPYNSFNFDESEHTGEK